MAFNQLSAREIELLALLMEEAGEIVQAAGKVLRHGWTMTYPAGGRSNREKLEAEIGHLMVAVDLLARVESPVDRQMCLSQHFIGRSCAEKAATVGEWLHEQSAPAGEAWP